MFNIGGCEYVATPCPKGPNTVDDHTEVGGGLALGSPFGTFYAPPPKNFPDATDGIGGWSEAGFVTAMWDGTAPERLAICFRHFPTGSFGTCAQRLCAIDLVCLSEKAAASPGQGALGHDLAFPSISAAWCGWKFCFSRRALRARPVGNRNAPMETRGGVYRSTDRGIAPNAIRSETFSAESR